MPSENELKTPAPEEKETKTWGSTGITGLVRHNPSGIYYHRYSVSGKRTYRSLETRRFPTAKLQLAKKSEEVEMQRQAGMEPGELRTLGDCEKLLLFRLVTSPQKQSTKDNYKTWLARLLRAWPDYRTFQIERVSGETLVALRTKLQKVKFHKGRTKKWTTGYKVGTINQTLLLVKLLLDLAREKRVIFANPFHDDRGLFGKIFIPQINKKLDLPSHFDMARIFEEVGKQAEHPAAWLAEMYRDAGLNASEMARFLSYSGMRLQESNAAQWEDVLGGTRIRVRGTKSESSERHVPIIPAMANLLEEVRKRRATDKRPLRGKILQSSTVLKNLARACAKLKLPNITQHGLRHYFATICIESGVDVPTVSKWLGHSDGGAIAMRVYGHLRDEHSLAAAQKVTFGLPPAVGAVATFASG